MVYILQATEVYRAVTAVSWPQHITVRSKVPGAQIKSIVNLGLFTSTPQASDQAGRLMVAAAQAVIRSTAGGNMATPEGQCQRELNDRQ